MKSKLTILLISLFLVVSPSAAQTWFTLADYLALKENSKASSELILQVMSETVFYAQESVGGPVICASPAPISGAYLAQLLVLELETPTNARGRRYNKNDHLAFVLMHAMRQQGICR